MPKGLRCFNGLVLWTACLWCTANGDDGLCIPHFGLDCEKDNNLLDAGKTEDAGACCAKCRETEGCKAWSWNMNTLPDNLTDWRHQCFLKGSCTYKTTDPNVITGFLGAAPDPVPDDECKHPSTLLPNFECHGASSVAASPSGDDPTPYNSVAAAYENCLTPKPGVRCRSIHCNSMLADCYIRNSSDWSTGTGLGVTLINLADDDNNGERTTVTSTTTGTTAVSSSTTSATATSFSTTTAVTTSEGAVDAAGHSSPAWLVFLGVLVNFGTRFG